MRLIDVDKLLDALCDGCTGIPCEGNRHGSMEECQSVRIMSDVIHEQPTAYDVDKVVEELAELAECSSQCASTFYEGLGCGACMWTDVFNIVRRGGAYEGN